MPGTGAFPTLAELWAWPTEHLTEGADHWDATAGRWYEVFTQVWQDSLSVDWEGKAAEELRTQTYIDKLQVGALVDQLHEAAKTARLGASDLGAARSRVRYAVEDARAAGFEVGEGLSVTDRSTGGTAALQAARQAHAEVFAADIRRRAAQLVALDRQVAAGITTALAGLGRFSLGEAPAPAGSDEQSPMEHNDVQLVDNHRRQDLPPGSGPPAPDGPHLIYCYPSARPDFWWCEGYEVGEGPYAFDSPIDISGVR